MDEERFAMDLGVGFQVSDESELRQPTF